MSGLKAAALALLTVGVAAMLFSARPALRTAPTDATTWNVELVDATAVEALPPTDAGIAAFRARVEEHPGSAPDHVTLGRLYLRRAAESGDDALYAEAERTYRRAFTLVPDNPSARLGLASALAAQHQFSLGLELIEPILEQDPENRQALMAAGDAYVALGRYAEAATAHEASADLQSGPPATARLAQLEELHGNVDEALALFEFAALEALQLDALADDLAWYLTRLADSYFHVGNYDASARHAEVAYAVSQRQHPALALLARARAAQGRYDEAIEAGERLVAAMPHPELIGQLGDLYAATGRIAEAEQQYQRVIALSITAGPVEDRPLARFLADHDLQPEQALLRAERDVELRPNIEAHDLHAWALYRNGRFEAAAEAIERALRLGTRRADFYYHAGMIYGALGDVDRSISFLQEALAINPGFDPLQAPLAREHLETQRAAHAS